MSGVGNPFGRPPNNVTMPEAAFDSLIGANGPRLTWAKSHACPCTGQGLDASGYGVPGGAQPGCQTCFGLGVYWDPFVPPFTGLVTFGSFLPIPTEPGMRMNEKWGQIQNATPLITVGYAQQPTVWAEMSTYDQIVEIDTPTRYNAALVQGMQTVLPLVNGLQVAPSGAVTVYNQETMKAVPVAYTVTGNQVILTDPTIPVGTPYMVEFYADMTYVLFRRSGALPHRRPFGGATVQKLPTRFTAETLDLWLRNRNINAAPPNWNGSAAAGASYPISQNTGTAIDNPGTVF